MAVTTLTVNDMCDRCGARASVKVHIGNGELLFCAHHAKEFNPVLARYDVEEISQPN
jgi:hypothetical protein